VRVERSTPCIHAVLIKYYILLSLEKWLSSFTIPIFAITFITEARDIASEASNKLHKYNRIYCDKHHKKPTLYKAGDLVLIRNLQAKAGTSKKLKLNYKGPYIITKVLNKNRYVVKDVPRFNITQKPYNSILSPDKLKPWIKPVEEK